MKKTLLFLCVLIFVSVNASESPTKPRGLENLGNTCYINSVLQCLFAIPTFRDDLEKIGTSKRFLPSSSTITLNLYHLLQEYKKSNYPIEPSNFFSCISAKQILGSGVDLYSQQDATEFYERLMQSLHPQRTVKQIFGVSYKTEIKSDSPDFAPPAIEHTNEFLVKASKNYFSGEQGVEKTILDFFQKSVKEEVTVQRAGRNRVFETQQQNILTDAQSILVIGAPRYNEDYTKNLMPIWSDLTPFSIKVKKNNKETFYWYELIGSVLHTGDTMNSGHYIAVTRYGKDWYYCSDTIVEKKSSGDVKAILQGATGFATVLFFFEKDLEAEREHNKTIVEIRKNESTPSIMKRMFTRQSQGSSSKAGSSLLNID